MQKPDADGFVTINWPSRNIPHGGIFHTRTVTPSLDRQQFLKVLLEESKLDIQLRKKNPFGSANDERAKPAPSPIPEVPTVRPRTSRRRSLSVIRESGALDIDDYRPLKKGEDREKLKEKLAQTMEHGDSPEPQVILVPQKQTPKVEKKLPTTKEQWNELVTQIRERAEWLAEMEYLGQGDPHRDIIKEQIAERMRALDALGIESICSSARSSASGFSTLRSREAVPIKDTLLTRRSTASVKSLEKASVKSLEKASVKSLEKASVKSLGNASVKNSAKNKNRISKRDTEESVTAYPLTPLQYSPRRRQ